MTKHRQVYGHEYGLDERCFWRSHPQSRESGPNNQNAVFRFQCACGSAGTIFNSPPGHSRLLRAVYETRKDGGYCRLTAKVIDLQMERLIDLPDDCDVLGPGEESRRAEAYYQLLREEHRRREEAQGGI